MDGVDHAEGAARLALDQAITAKGAGTFGVGAVLIHDPTGEILDTAANDVVRRITCPNGTGEDGTASGESACFTHDPTAHGERQLISRYFERSANGDELPSPGQLTIVSSLEPCAMCSGAIMASDFKVGVVSLDRTAGLGMAEGRNFRSLPERIRKEAASRFGYYEIPETRPFVGSTRIAFAENEKTRVVAKEVLEASEQTFLGSLDRVIAVVSEGGEFAPAADPSDLSPGSSLRSLLEERLPHFLSLRLDDHREASSELLELLRALSAKNPGRGSAAALIDHFGNLLLASGGGLTADPTATGFADMLRTYSRVRFDLASAPDLSRQADEYLGHPKFGTIYRYPEPDPESPSTLFELGAYGSTMEGPLPADRGPNLQLIGEGIDATRLRDQLRSLVGAMPPFYSETVGLDFEVTSF